MTFQTRVKVWLLACFGEEVAGDKEERTYRFLEEALELAQACGASPSSCHELVNYTFSRPVGEKFQEVGGVMVTLAALCLANSLSMDQAGERELERVWKKIDEIRKKNESKPDFSPLPGKDIQSVVTRRFGSVVQSWVTEECSYKQQAVILSALRGCDGIQKEDISKQFTRQFRFDILNPAENVGKGDRQFMTPINLDGDMISKFLSNIDHYPVHWLFHFMHAMEIVGYKHPDQHKRMFWFTMYENLCNALHVRIESEKTNDLRLSDHPED